MSVEARGGLGGAATEPSPRMRRILDAAVVVTARSGLRGLTHRAVDAEAQLPQGSTSAYLRTRLALLLALTDHMAAGLKGAVDDLALELRSGAGEEVVVEHAIDLFARWLDDPELLLCRVELEREALRQEEIKEALEPWRRRLLATVGEIVGAVGVDEPELRATAIIAAVDGVLVDALSRPPAERVDYVRRVARVIITAFVTLRDAPT